METVTENVEEVLNDIVKALIGQGFSEEEIGKIKDFLNRKFSVDGMIAIASIFTYARRHDPSISVDKILDECEKEWQRNWKYQDPNIKGDPAIGPQNRISLENIYEAIGVPSPARQKTN